MKNKKILMFISIITLMSFVIGVTYAYFSTVVVGNDTASSNTMTAGALQLTYNGEDFISFENAIPSSTDSLTFTVANTGTLPISSYNIYFSKVVNTFINDEVVYEIECVSSDAVPCLGKVETPIPNVTTLALVGTAIAPGTTHTYTVDVTFIETGDPQDYNQWKELSFTFTINEPQYLAKTLVGPTYVAWPDLTSGYFWDYKEEITSLTFEDVINVPIGAIETWDVSSEQDESVMAYIIDDGLGTNTYELYIQSNNNIYANPNCMSYFAGFEILTTINNLDLFITSNVTNMGEMFMWCYLLTSLDLSSFDTSNVTDMSWMFVWSDNLTSINVSSFDTSKVINMEYMFYYCVALLSLDVSSFSTNSLVGSIYGIFGGCESMTTINLGTMSFSNVTGFEWMFKDCYALESLDISNIDTSSALNMSGTFFGCHSLTSLDISTLDTSNVTNMIYLFSELINVTSLDLSTLDTSSAINMGSMFEDSPNLTNLNLSSFDTSLVTNMSWMFSGCDDLVNLNVSSFNTSNVTNMSGMFAASFSLVNLDLSTFNTPLLTNVSSMFDGCSGLTDLELRNATFTLATSNTNMFRNITNGINIVVKDASAQTYINARLTAASRTGNVTIYV